MPVALADFLTQVFRHGVLLAPPILFGFPPHRWRFRVLDLHPNRRPPRAIGRTKTFAYDPLAPELTRRRIDARAFLLEMLIEGYAQMRTLEQLGEKVLSYFYWLAPQILAVQFQQIEGA